jgi:hypothetical protein
MRCTPLNRKLVAFSPWLMSTYGNWVTFAKNAFVTVRNATGARVRKGMSLTIQAHTNPLDPLGHRSAVFFRTEDHPWNLLVSQHDAGPGELVRCSLRRRSGISESVLIRPNHRGFMLSVGLKPEEETCSVW